MGINVALDGPSGAGKSSIAKKAAASLGYIYVDTGAIYRSVALFMLRNNVDIKNKEEVSAKLSEIDVKLEHKDKTQVVVLNGEDVSELIRTPEISMAASAVSAIPEVRTFLLDLQRNIARENNIIMDGRDIGTVVLPNAQVKIFLTASAEERAKRRFKELQEKGDKSTYEEVLKDIIQRDYNDAHRETAPLKQAEDAVLVDTSDMDFDRSVEKIISVIKEKTAEEKLQKKKEHEVMARDPVEPGKNVNCFLWIVHQLFRFLVWIAYKIWYKVEYVGTENCPKGGGNMYVCTHRSYADPVLVSIPVRGPFRFMAKEELFKGNIFFKWLIIALGAFPIKRGNGDTEAIEKSIRTMKKGRNFLIFPEGTRSRDGKVGKIRSGAALIGAVSQTNIVPVAICFEGRKLKFRSRIIVAFGKSFTPAELGADSTSPRCLKLIKNKISQELNNLVNENVKKL